MSSRATLPRVRILGAEPACRRAALAALALATWWWLCAPCRADGLVLSLSNPEIIAAPASSGTFEIWLTNTGTSSVSVAADAFELTLSGPGDVSFTDVSTATTLEPYIYSQSLVENNPLIPFSFSTLPGTDVAGQDTWDNINYPGGSATLSPGQVVGLGLVSFSTNSTASGVYSINFGNATSLSDPNENDVPIAGETGGTITIQSVPEPSGPALLAIGLATVAAGRWLRARLKAHRATFRCNAQ